jgi:GH25 family lysozyme M1 (1,4-beta-N-acetylmuramidase)
MEKLLEFLAWLVKVLFGGDSESPAPETPRETPVEEAVTGWEGDPPYRYIDVSRYQGNITLEGWKKVKAAGYQGVMLKTVSTNRRLSKRADGLYIDPTFETNYRNAKAAGLAVGVYYYTYATSEAMADAELSLLADALRGKTLEMPVAVDVEDNKFRVLGKQALTDLTAYALKKVEDMGFYAQLYTYTSFAKTRLYMGGAALSPYDVWLADYTGKTPAVTFAYNSHQHTSKGSVPGITGNVDLNVTTLNYPKIIRKKGLTRLREGK